MLRHRGRNRWESSLNNREVESNQQKSLPPLPPSPTPTHSRTEINGITTGRHSIAKRAWLSPRFFFNSLHPLSLLELQTGRPVGWRRFSHQHVLQHVSRGKSQLGREGCVGKGVKSKPGRSRVELTLKTLQAPPRPCSQQTKDEPTLAGPYVRALIEPEDAGASKKRSR